MIDVFCQKNDAGLIFYKSFLTLGNDPAKRASKILDNSMYASGNYMVPNRIS
jgi:hypothetical protein